MVVRTFSKTWSMAACRLGYLVADPDVVAACDAVVLPYHLDAITQAAGRLALRHVDAMEERVALITEERASGRGRSAELAVESWPSDANFVLLRPTARAATDVWHDLLARVGVGARLLELARPRQLPACHGRYARGERPFPRRPAFEPRAAAHLTDERQDR